MISAVPASADMPSLRRFFNSGMLEFWNRPDYNNGKARLKAQCVKFSLISDFDWHDVGQSLTYSP